MKKIIASTLLTSSLFAFDLGSALTSELGSVLTSLLGESDVSKTIGMCYQSDISIPNISGMCSSLDYQINQSIDICSIAPDIPGLSKKTSSETIGFNTDALKNYCAQTDVEEKLSSVTSNAEIWAIENEGEDDYAYPNGVKKSEFYTNVLDMDELNKKQNESITAMYYSSKEPHHQQTAKYLFDLAKLKKVDDVTDITVDDVKVAGDMIEYETQINELSATVTSDVKISSANSVSSTLSSKLNTYDDSAGQTNENKTANEYADKLKEIVKKTARNKKGLYKELLSTEDDLALPTQQTVDLYKDNIKPKYAMLIRKQQARESYVNALIDTEVQIRQDIIDLTAKKAVIMKFQFDSDSAMNDIDNFVD